MGNMYKYIISICLYSIILYLTGTPSFNCSTNISQKNVWSEVHARFTLEGHRGEILRAIFSPNGNNIITLSEDSTAIIWEAVNGQLVHRLIGHKGAVRCAWFIEDGAKIQTFADDRVIKIWDCKTGVETSSVQISENNTRIICAEFSPDGKKLAIGLQGTAEVYQTKSGGMLLELSPFGHPGLRVNTTDIGFRIDGCRIITAAYSHEVAVWDAQKGARLLNLHGHGAGCLSAVFSPDMTMLASGSRDKTVIIWDARSGKVIDEINIGWEVKSVAFNPGGSTLFLVENVKKGEVGRLSIWDLSTKSQINKIEVTGKIGNNSFSSEENFLVVPFHNKAIVYSPSQSDRDSKKELPEVVGDIKELTKIAISDENEVKRIIACRELMQYNKKLDKVTSDFISALKSKDKNIRFNATLALAEIGKSLEGLTAILKNLLIHDTDPQVRAAAALALGNFSFETGKTIAIQELIQALIDPYLWVRYHAAHALEKMTRDTVVALSQLVETVLSDSATSVRRQIAFNLGNAGKKSLNALPLLIEGTKSHDERTRWWACYTIWCISSATGDLAKTAIPALKKAIRDSSDYRDENGGPPYKYAIHALCGIGPVVKIIDPEIIPILKDIMENDDEYFQRKAAALALESILEIKGLRQKVRGYVRR